MLWANMNNYGELIHFQGRQHCIFFFFFFFFALLVENGFTLREKKIAPLWSKFFPFRVDPFQKHFGCSEANRESQ